MNIQQAMENNFVIKYKMRKLSSLQKHCFSLVRNAICSQKRTIKTVKTIPGFKFFHFGWKENVEKKLKLLQPIQIEENSVLIILDLLPVTWSCEWLLGHQVMTDSIVYIVLYRENVCLVEQELLEGNYSWI